MGSPGLPTKKADYIYVIKGTDQILKKTKWDHEKTAKHNFLYDRDHQQWMIEEKQLSATVEMFDS